MSVPESTTNGPGSGGSGPGGTTNGPGDSGSGPGSGGSGPVSGGSGPVSGGSGPANGNGARAGSGPALPTGRQFELRAGPYRAAITGLGAALRALDHDGQPLILGYQAEEVPPASAGQLLLPWPNRIGDGRYAFDGDEFQLAITEPARNTAIHGLTRWLEWAPVHQDQDRVVLRCGAHAHQGYPFTVEFEASYQLDPGQGLRAQITAWNQGTGPAPYGNGAHPYLTAGTGAVDEWELTLPASRWQPADGQGLPDGKPLPAGGTEFDFRDGRRIGGTVLDHALTGLVTGDDGRAWAHLAGRDRRVSIWAGPGYQWLQVFTSDPLPAPRHRAAVAIEPMTCPPNAFATGTDLLVLQPGERVSHSWGITTG